MNEVVHENVVIAVVILLVKNKKHDAFAEDICPEQMRILRIFNQ